ncbi:MAG: hypothetical protein PVF68_02320 [Acidobacteriota bacterium]
MSESHHILDSDTEETAEEFLRRLSAPPRPTAAPPPGTRWPRRGPGSPRHAPVIGGRGARPWVAATSSLLLWGGGQWLNGQRALALLFLSLQGLAIALGYALAVTWGRLVDLGWVFEVDEPALAVGAFGLAAAVPLLWMTGVLQAYARATRGPKPWRYDGPAFGSALASALVPGCGQLMNGQLGKGATFLGLWGLAGYGLGVSLRFPELWGAFDRSFRPLAGTSCTAVQLGMITLLGLVWVVGTYDAFLTARGLAGGR